MESSKRKDEDECVEWQQHVTVESLQRELKQSSTNNGSQYEEKKEVDEVVEIFQAATKKGREEFDKAFNTTIAEWLHRKGVLQTDLTIDNSRSSIVKNLVDCLCFDLTQTNVRILILYIILLIDDHYNYFKRGITETGKLLFINIL